MEKAIIKQEWYQQLVEECKAILVERFYNSNLEAITAYGEIGERIFTDPNYQKYGKGNRKFNLQLFKDIKIGERTGYYCLQFYEKKLKDGIENGKYKDVCNALQTIYQKNITWKKVILELPELKDQEEELSAEELAKFQKQVIHGDCLIELKKIKDKSVDMIYVDPPYNVGKDEWDKFELEEFLNFTTKWIKECCRILKDRSHFFIHFPSQKSAWLEDLILTEFSMIPTTRLIWHYRNLSQGRQAAHKFLSTYQPMLHYCFGEKPLNFPNDWTEERFDVWVIAATQSNFKEGHDHPTQKPLELMERLVRFGSKQGELVLDPMAGSGTTGVAALKHNRDFILIEKDKNYIILIHRRLNELDK